MELFFEIFAFVIGLIAWKWLNPNYLKAIVILLGVTAFNEGIIVNYVHSVNVNLTYNIFSFIDMFIWSFVFYEIHKRNALRRWVLILSSISIIYSLLELSFFKNWITFHTDSIRFYSVCIIIFSVGYLYKLIKEEFYELNKDPIFILCTACIIYHSLLFLNVTTMAENNYWFFKNAQKIFYFLGNLGNEIYYLLISISFFECIYYNRILIKT